jgi:hypothetical protein
MKTDPHRLADYVRQIAAKHGGLEGLRHEIGEKFQPYNEGGLESVVSQGEGTATTAQKALERIEMGQTPAPQEIDGLEAIIDAERGVEMAQRSGAKRVFAYRRDS